MIWQLPCPLLLRNGDTKASLKALSSFGLANMRR